MKAGCEINENFLVCEISGYTMFFVFILKPLKLLFGNGHHILLHNMCMYLEC